MFFFVVVVFFQFERHCRDVNKDEVQYNITKYFGSKTLNMRKQKHILSQFLVSVTSTLTLIDTL